MRQAIAGLAALAGIIAVGAAVRLRMSVAPDARQQAIERAQTPGGMVYVPGGNCLVGSNDPDAEDALAEPQHTVFVPSFYMDRTEVTNAEYKRFQPGFEFPPGEANLPVTNVTYDEAAAYARWAGKRLPTDEEWEKAARGTDGRRYPWGNTWDPKRVAQRAHHGKNDAILTQRQSYVKRPGQCAVGPSRVQPVASIPGGASPYGCVDMAGNAWEWVQGFYHGNPEMRLLRGGAVGYGERDMRTYARAIEGAGAT